MRLKEELAALQAVNEAAGQAAKDLLALASKVDASDSGAAELLLGPIEEIGRSAQARRGELVLLLAQADRFKAIRGGLAPWISTHLDVTEGAARGIARSAREIATYPSSPKPSSPAGSASPPSAP